MGVAIESPWRERALSMLAEAGFEDFGKENPRGRDAAIVAYWSAVEGCYHFEEPALLRLSLRVLRRNARAMALTESLLDAEERRMRDPAYRELKKLREPIIERAMAAKTQEEIDEARGAIEEWLEKYPAEKGVFSDELLQMRMKEESMKVVVGGKEGAFPVDGFYGEHARRGGSF